MLPFCKPTAYGLGKSGWVSAAFAEPPVLQGRRSYSSRQKIEMFVQPLPPTHRQLVYQVLGPALLPPGSVHSAHVSEVEIAP